MSYRFNTIDIIVGFGMCAIIFGALLFFVAANGTYQVALTEPLSHEEPVGVAHGSTWLQPALGQAIVDHTLSERRLNQAIAQSAFEWNRATVAYHGYRSRQDGSLGLVLRQAMTVPTAHMARVQGILGRAIVNFTKRGFRNDLLSADQDRSPYNLNMIRMTEARGLRLHHDFASTWQATLGGRIVDAAQLDRQQAGAIQERLGAALLQLLQAQVGREAARATQQEQLGSLVLAAIRTEALADRATLSAAVQPPSQEAAVVSTEPAAWPEIPIGFLMIAALMLAAVFLGGLSLAVQSREKKALADMRDDAARWVYRMAA